MELIFIYNAKSGAINSLFDFSHKLISPSTYVCSLCSITYGNFGAKKQWQNFLNELDIKSIFLYKNQLQKINYKPNRVPCVLLKTNPKNIQEIISADELNTFVELTELINKLRLKLLSINPKINH
ncbi:MAG: GTPase [Vicingaceae bacterium]|nr:GTPase [Vicingaceae bacterium]